MQHRYQNRAATDEDGAMDKKHNPLIAIPGSEIPLSSFIPRVRRRL